jgi:polyisoprenoid-binding protein YceI
MLSSWMLALLCCIWQAKSQVPVLTPQKKDSRVEFQIKNFGLAISGRFNGLSGKISFHPNQLGSSSFQVSIPATSIDSDNSMRDRHLRKSDYFSVDKFPNITFVSNRIYTSQNNNRYSVVGVLTIKGVAKTIAFDFDAQPAGTGYRLIGSFGLNRLDFGVGTKSISLSDAVEVRLDVTALMP